jgi:dTDP-4-amino-4,6-dideoxygalactose transaminase
MYYLLLPTLEARQNFIQYLKEKRILSVFHYLPLHLSEMGRAMGGHAGECPVTESISDRLVRLPFYHTLAHEEQCQVIEAIQQFRC